MNQLTFPGWEEPAPPGRGVPARARYKAKFKLFVALFPPATQAQAIAERAEHWRQQFGLSARCLEAARLHVTLQVLGDYADEPALSVIDAARAALAGVDHPAVHTCWNRLLSFPRNGALVLRCDAGSDMALAQLRHAVQQALAGMGLGAMESSTPHMTLLYDQEHVVAENPIDPLSWTATELALIISHLGEHHHQGLGRWPLRPSCT